MGDWQNEHEHRYLLHFSDGGAGMRHFDRQLQVGDEHRDGGSSYVIVKVEETEARAGFGHAWAELRE